MIGLRLGIPSMSTTMLGMGLELTSLHSRSE